MNKIFDVAVIGASIAGSICAGECARAGLAVALIDRAVFPRRKACGEGLSVAGVHALERLGHWEAMQLPAQPFRGFKIWGPGGLIAELGGRTTAGFGVERTALDTALLHRITSLGPVQTYLGTPVTGLTRGASWNEVRLGATRILARRLVLADGGASPMSTLLGIRRRIPATSRFGITFHLSGSGTEIGSVHVFTRPEGEVYCTPLPYGRLNINFLGQPGTRIAPRGWLEQEVLPAILKLIGLSDTLIEGPETAPIGAAAIGGARPSVWGNVMLIGDACEQLDPIGGMGMTHAIVSGDLAAQSIVQLHRGKLSELSVLRRYAALREEAVRPLRGFTAMTYRSLVARRSSPLTRMMLRSPLALRISDAIHGGGQCSISRRALACIGACVAL